MPKDVPTSSSLALWQWLDMPPIWLGGFVGLAWLQGKFFSFSLAFSPAWINLIAGLLVGGGVLLIALAALQFRRSQTTIIPHHEAERLITEGVYRRSRNPIYLGDAMILLGLVVLFDAVLALVLVPIFVWVIERRFVIPEENRLRRKFRADFARWAEKTRRWL